MKKSLVVVALAGALVLLFAPSLFADWETEKRLTNYDSMSVLCYNNARCVAVSGDTVHVVWYDRRDGNQEIYYKRSLNNGVSWAADYRLTTNDSASINPSIAVSGSNVHVVWSDHRDGNDEIYYKRSTDGGTTWGLDTRRTTNDSASSNPSVAVLGDTVHLVWTDYRDGNAEVYYKRSTDNGITWTGDYPLTVDDDSISYFPSVSVSPTGAGTFVHVVWEDGRQGRNHTEVYYKLSTNNGSIWGSDVPLTNAPGWAKAPSVFASGLNVHLVWRNYNNGNEDIFYRHSLDGGTTWSDSIPINSAPGLSTHPTVSASGRNVHVVWEDDRDNQGYPEVFYNFSTDNGANWSWFTRLSPIDQKLSGNPSLAVSGSAVHVVWMDARWNFPNYEIYYRRNPSGNPFTGYLTEPSQGRHLLRNPSSGMLYLVMKSEDDKIYFTRSVDNGVSWMSLEYLGDGKYPTVGLAWTILDWPVVCVAYKRTAPAFYRLSYRWQDPTTGVWQSAMDIAPASVTDPGPPSLITSGGRVYVGYQTGSSVKCSNFDYNAPGSYVTETIDATQNPSQPCLAVDGSGYIYGAWKRRGTGNDTMQIWYAPRGNPPTYWSSKLRVDLPNNNISQQPFVECYGDSVFVVWADSTPAEIRRRSKEFGAGVWRTFLNVSNSSDLTSESPTQACREFTTWAESVSTENSKLDIEYWSPSSGLNWVQSNPSTWSYWPHSQMWLALDGLYLANAWTESPRAYQSPYTVLTKTLSWVNPLGEDIGVYYAATAGDTDLSPYLRNRDGVIRFGDKAVDYSRDSLVYELPYLDPHFDYFVKVSSYHEGGSDWAQGVSVNGAVLRSMQFASNRVDTVWVKIPPEAYRQDRKVVFSLKNLRGDYVTSLGLKLYQRDPLRGKGGPQSAGLADLPQREVFAVSPNPTRGEVQVVYSLRTPGKVDLSVYDVLGRLVKRVVKNRQPAGVYRAAWDGRDQAGGLSGSGVYFLRLSTPEMMKTKRVVVVK